MVQRLLIVLALLAPAWFAPGLVSAQVGGPRLHLGAGLSTDAGGEVEFNDSGPDRDLDASIGLRGHLDYAVHRYVSIGGMVKLSWWEPDDTPIDRSFLFDLGPRVIGHYDWRDFRFYGGISPGLTISAIDDDLNGIDNPAAGFTLSLTIVGAEWWFSRKVGLFAEIGWVGHWFEHDTDGAGDFDVEMSQAMLVPLGFVFGV